MPAARMGPDTPPPEISKQSSQSLCAEGVEITMSEECNPRIRVSVRDEACHGIDTHIVFSRSSRAISLEPLLLDKTENTSLARHQMPVRNVQL
jgi:hypothetical protein